MPDEPSAGRGTSPERESSSEGQEPIVHRVEARETLLEGVPLLDLRGLNCPLPALKTGKRMRSLAAGQRLWVETTDPLAVIDIPAHAAENGHVLIKSEPVEGGGHRFLLERAHDEAGHGW